MRTLFAALVAASALSAATAANSSPWIAVIGSPKGDDCDTRRRSRVLMREDRELVADDDQSGGDASCFADMYAKWIQSAGARVVGIPYDSYTNHKDMLDEILSSVNGVLFTGGGLDLAPSSDYYKTALYIFQQVQKMNDAGTHFPLHGTCMGFELLNILGAGGNSSVLLSGFESFGLALPLTFTSSAANSSYFGSAPASIRNIFQEEDVTLNLHHDGVPASMYGLNDDGGLVGGGNPTLQEFFSPLSTNKDSNGRVFVSTIEAHEYPIVGTQWHPERPQFEWNPELNVPHSADTIAANYWAATYFVGEARKNNQTWSDTTLAQGLVTYSMDRLSMSGPLVGYDALVFDAPEGY